MKASSINLFLIMGITGVDAFTVRNSPGSVRCVGIPSSSPLFQQRSSDHGKHSPLLSLAKNNMRRNSLLVRELRPRILHLVGKFRRSAAILAVSLLLFGTTLMKPLPAHASTAVQPRSEPKRILSASLEHIVDRYVKDHMFDDDVYEPVESLYREAFHDKVRGTHPKALSVITSSVLGQDGAKVEKASSSSGIADWLMGAVNFLQRKGISESTAIILLTGTFVIVGPITFLLGATMVGSQSKRQIKSVMKKRYGDTYTVDATIKSEDDIELPDENEDDDEEEDGDGEEDDDEDDD